MCARIGLANAPLSTLSDKGRLITPTLIVCVCRRHTRCRPAAQLLVVELQRHAVVVILATLLQELLLNPRARRLVQLLHLHGQLSIREHVTCRLSRIAANHIASSAIMRRVMVGCARGGQDLVIVLEAGGGARLLRHLHWLATAGRLGSGDVGHLAWHVGWLTHTPLLRVLLRLLLLRNLLRLQLHIHFGVRINIAVVSMRIVLFIILDYVLEICVRI